jgi:Ca2+-dependent lipid-binding protein
VEYTGMLRVRVVSAAGLPSMDVDSPSDPYVVVKLSPGQERRTKTKWDNNDPRWG